MNLLAETIACLENNGKTVNDVIWVGTENEKATWNSFASVADFDYDNGWLERHEYVRWLHTQNRSYLNGSDWWELLCGEVVDTALLVVGKDFWLERHEYDGSEWWEFKALPFEPETVIELTQKDLKWHW